MEEEIYHDAYNQEYDSGHRKTKIILISLGILIVVAFGVFLLARSGTVTIKGITPPITQNSLLSNSGNPLPLANGTSTTFKTYIVSDNQDIIHHQVEVEVQNQNSSSNENLDLGLLINQTNISAIRNINIYEWKPVAVSIPTYNTTFINQTCFNNVTNSSSDCSYNSTVQNGTTTKNILTWKSAKANLFSNNTVLKQDYGSITVPKLGSKCKYDDNNDSYDCNGTKLFKIEWDAATNSKGYYLLYDSLTNDTLYDPWWNDSWSYYKPITITENSGNTLNNYTIHLNISYTSHMNSSFQDLRFVDSDNTTQLSYWIENKSNSHYANIWIKVPTLTASSNHTIYMYYGNPAVINQSSTAAFLMYDDFNRASIGSNWTTLGSLGASITSGVVTVSTGGSQNGFYYWNKNNFTTPVEMVTSSKIYVGPTSSYTWSAIGFGTIAANPTSNDGFFGNTYNPVYRIAAAGGNVSSGINSNVNIDSSVFHTFGMSWTSSHLNFTHFDNNYSISGVVNGAPTAPLALGFWIQQNAHYISTDWVRVQRFTKVPPTYALGSEQQQLTSGINLVSPTNLSLINTTTFNWTILNTTGVVNNVTLWINNTSEFTNTSGKNGTYQHTLTGIADGYHSWKVSGFIDNTQTNSSTQYFTLDATAPVIHFVNKTPSNINTTGLYINGLKLVYNATDVSGVNSSSMKLFYKTNNSVSNIFQYINGTATQGYFNETGTNVSQNYTFSLDDNDVYPGVFPLNSDTFSDTAHSSYNITTFRAVKTQLLNVTNTTNYNIFEFMANSSVGASPLYAFYCNSTYTSGDVSINPNCDQFGSLAATQTFATNETGLGNSSYQYLDFPINTSTGKIGTVKVTPVSYFVLYKSGVGGTWYSYYVPVESRSTTTATSINKGNAWSPQTYTFDMHLHQYQGTDVFRYYSCGEDNLGNNGCSSKRFDGISESPLPPTVPHVITPTSQFYNHNNINITYQEAIPENGGSILYYNITLANATDNSYIKTIMGNNSRNLSYSWNTTGTPYGQYKVEVVAYASNNLSSFDYSTNFTLDSVYPKTVLVAPTNTSPYTLANITFNATLYDSGSGLANSTLHVWDIGGISIYTNTKNNTGTNSSSIWYHTLTSNDNYLWNVYTCDKSGNCKYNETNGSFTLSLPYPNVTLNSPANDSTQYTNSITFNATAHSNSSYYYLTNISLWTKLNSGVYSRNQTINLILKNTSLIYEDPTVVSYGTDNNPTLERTVDFSSAPKLVNYTTATDWYGGSATGSTVRYKYAYNDSTYAWINYTVTATPTDYNYTNPNPTKWVSYIYVYLARGGSAGGVSDNDTRVFGIGNYFNKTSTFTNTYNPGDNIIWNVQACASDGFCSFATSSNVFNIDSTAPTISISSPAGLYSFLYEGKNLTLNTTVSDANLNKVWYSYNGTNHTIAVVNGTIFTTNFTYQVGENSLTVWANDTNGNINSSTTTWSGASTLNSITYNSTAYETSSQSFIANMSAPSTPTDVKLWYNNIPYTATVSSLGGNNYLITYNNFQLGTVATDTVEPFNFTFKVNSTTTGTNNYNQTVKNMELSYCTSGSSYLNFTFRDESDNSSLNAKNDLTTIYYWVSNGNGQYYNTLSVSNSTNNSYYAFCLSPSVPTIKTNITFKYSGTNYPQRTYQRNNLALTNSTTNQILYMLSSVDGIYSTIAVNNYVSQPIEGVTVSMARQLTAGTWTTIGTGTTGSDGSVTFWVNPNYQHKVTAVKTGYPTATVTITPTQSIYTLTLGSSPSSTASHNSSVPGIVWIPRPPAGAIKTGNQSFNATITSSLSNIVNCQYQLVNGSNTAQVLETNANVTNSSYCFVGVNYDAKVSHQLFGVISVETTQSNGTFIILDSDLKYTPFPNDTSSLTISSFWSGLTTLGEWGTGNEAVFSRLVVFFIVVTTLIAVFNYFTESEITSPGISMIIIWGIVITASAAGFLAINLNNTDLTSTTFMGKWSLAIVYSFMVGARITTQLRRDN